MSQFSQEAILEAAAELRQLTRSEQKQKLMALRQQHGSKDGPPLVGQLMEALGLPGGFLLTPAERRFFREGPPLKPAEVDDIPAVPVASRAIKWE